jgi:hypothetical protein
MATTSDAQPGVAPATEALLQEILLELQTLNRKLDVRDAEPVSSDVVLNKSILETSLLAMVERMTPEVGTLDSEDAKEESEIDMKLEVPELALGAEIESNSGAEGKTSKNVAQGSEARTLDGEDGKEEPDTGRKLEGPELASGAEISSNSEAEGETSENVAQGSEARVEVAPVDSAELLAQAAEDSPETGVKEEVENVERPYSDREVATGGERVGGSELEVVSSPNSHQVEDNDIPKKFDPIHRYHWDYPWSSASEEDRAKQTAGFPITEDIRDMWSSYIGCNWAIPADRRVGLSFDSWTLRRDADHGKERLEKLTNTLRLLKGSKLGDNSFQITDYPPSESQYFYHNDSRPAILSEKILGGVNKHRLLHLWRSKEDLSRTFQAPWGRLM